MNKLLIVLSLSITCVLGALLLCSCTPADASNTNNDVNEKISSQLLAQVSLRKAQISAPDPDRLELMQSMGMNVENLEIQMIFIHLNQTLSVSQIEELESMGINLYLDSWIPPVGAHPTGFLTADMPVDKLEALAQKGYVVKLDTAERLLEPQNGVKPQVE